MSIRDSELGNDAGRMVWQIEDIRKAYAKYGKNQTVERLLRASQERLNTAANILIKAGVNNDRCPECGTIGSLEDLGESCERAEEKFPVEDYYGDGCHYVPIGVHNVGVRCTAEYEKNGELVQCDFIDADACVHD